MIILSCILVFVLPLSDIDQCLVSNGGCDQSCVDLIPSHECSCNNGYVLDGDERSCNG